MNEITLEEFLQKYNAQKVDLISDGFITEEDYKELQQIESVGLGEKIYRLRGYLPFAFREPQFFKNFILPRVLPFINNDPSTKFFYETRTIKNAEIKTSLVKAFSPLKILEVGTYLGWASGCFKHAMPNTEIFTMNPKENADANNPILEKNIGYFCAKKNLKINQIWADSTQYDYSQLHDIDVAYIDGNHEYEYVKQDLENIWPIVKKSIILDDYVDQDKSKRSGIPYGPWNEGVVKAVNEFVSDKNHKINEMYQITNSPYCVLIK